MRISRRMLLTLAAAVVVVAVVGLGWAWTALSHAAPARFTIGAPRPASSPAATPTAPAQDPLTAACPAFGTLATVSPAGHWVVGSSSQAGFRVHERFLELQTPNEAVARTPDISGGLVLAGTVNELRLSTACIAVSTTTLHSVDIVPGMRTTDRDWIFRDVLASSLYPVATFRAADIRLPPETPSGRKVSIPVSGELTLHGVTRKVTFSLDAVLAGDQAQLVGGFPIQLGDYGMAAPDNPMAAVESQVTIEFQLFLDRR